MKDTGDKTPRKLSSEGASIPDGLSHRMKITETPEALGMGRSMDSGKPIAPQKGSMGGQKVA